MPTMTTDHPRVVVVTGGSGGIGGETAQRLARDGMAIDTVIIVPGSHREPTISPTLGTPKTYTSQLLMSLSMGGLMDQVSKKLADLALPDQDPAELRGPSLGSLG
jgi:NAD(P)-dependent dehydrogenase (short-subunit alcohol dehydrogenase family)